LPAHAIAMFAMAQQVRQPISPEGSIFMRSQNGPAKAKLLNMHTKALIRAFDKCGPKMPILGKTPLGMLRGSGS